MQMNSFPMMETSGDVELLELCLRGNREAYGHLVARYQSLVCSLAYSACGELARSEDLAQETFVMAWRHLGELRDRAKFKSWLCSIARNLVNNSLRRDRRDATRSAESLESVPEAVSAMPTPCDQAISREEESILWRALSEIPETYREPLVLFYREQQSVEQVATALELSDDAVKQRLSRGRALLKEQVAAFVETTLRNTRPGKAFTFAVLASLAAVVPQATAAGLAAGAAKGSAAVKSAAAVGLSSAVLGPLIGILGAYIGAKASIENTKSPRERQFMVKQTWWAVACVAAFLCAMALVIKFGKKLLSTHPVWFATLLIALVAGYAAGLMVIIVRANRRQRQIQIEDGTYIAPQEAMSALLKSSPQKARRGIYASLGGSIFGSVAFAFVLALQHDDWITAGAVVTVAVLLFGLGVRASLKKPQNSFRILISVSLAAGILCLLIVDSRWSSWMVSSPMSPPMKGWSLIGLNAFIVVLFALITVGLMLNQRLHRRSPPTSTKQS